MLISWYVLNLIPTCISTPIKNLSNKIVWVLHLVSIVFILCSSTNEAPSSTPSMNALQAVEKADIELPEVSNCVNALILRESSLRINMSPVGPIPNTSLTVLVPKDGYDGTFPIYLHLITFLLTSNRWLVIVEVSLPQPMSIIHPVVYIMNTLYFG